MADFTGFPDGSDNNLQISQNSSENLSTILDTEFYEFDNILSSQDSGQSVWIDPLEDQEDVEHK